MVNKSGDELTAPVALTGVGAGTAEVYRYSGANLAGVVRAADQPVGATGFTATFPANSITHLVLPRGDDADTEAPTAPGRPVAGAVTTDSVALSWAPATDRVGVTGYDVHRVEGTGTEKLGSATGTSFTATGLTADTAYTFVVTARDAAGNVSAASPGLTVRTAPVSTPTGGCKVSYAVLEQLARRVHRPADDRQHRRCGARRMAARLRLPGGRAAGRARLVGDLEADRGLGDRREPELERQARARSLHRHRLQRHLDRVQPGAGRLHPQRAAVRLS